LLPHTQPWQRPLNRFSSRRRLCRFVKLLREADERTPIRLLAYCLMPNHFHLVVWPHRDGDLSDYMKWLMHAHVRRYHQHYHSSGHIWQGRFKAFPIAADEHLLTVLRYVERNPLRANLVKQAETWRWSSLGPRQGDQPALDPGPVRRGHKWLEFVNEPQTEAEVKRLRGCVQRGRPFGSESWMTTTASELGLEASLRPRGRPKKWPGTSPSLF
jgi:putative transposase